jgi:hypothetical protein
MIPHHRKPTAATNPTEAIIPHRAGAFVGKRSRRIPPKRGDIE